MKSTNDTILIQTYLDYCKYNKRLDEKTIKAYTIDLRHFHMAFPDFPITSRTPQSIETYISSLHTLYKPRTVKRKIASIKAFYHHLEYRDIISITPFAKLQTRFREPLILPKTIPLHTIEQLLTEIYTQHGNAVTPYQQMHTLRDAAIIELLFMTGIRISELCSLSNNSINLHTGTILIYGKGDKERRLQITNANVLSILKKYKSNVPFCPDPYAPFFINQNGTPISDQSIRRMLRRYCNLANINLHITPHMFRHTFATSLLDADVDIRYIQEMLGHSSITTTEIYTHVSTAKQTDILTNKHPRKDFRLV